MTENDQNPPKPNITSELSRLRNAQIIEALFWLTIIIFVFFVKLVSFYRSPLGNASFEVFLADQYITLLFLFALFVFIILYKITFRVYPITFFILRARLKTIKWYDDKSINDEVYTPSLHLVSLPLTLFKSYAEASKIRADIIYGRANIFLVAGAFIGIVGIAIFYVMSSNESVDVINARLFTSLSARISLLVFIELLAFYFLKQYRTAMDEFRHFEGIQRRREETYAFLTYCEDGGIKPLDFIDKDCIFSKQGILSQGQTTELVELRKHDKDEFMSLFEKLFEMVSKVK